MQNPYFQQLMQHVTPERWALAILSLVLIAALLCRAYHKAFWARFQERFGFRPNSWESRESQQGRIEARLAQDTSNCRAAAANVEKLRQQLQEAERELSETMHEKRLSERMAAKAGFTVA